MTKSKVQTAIHLAQEFQAKAREWIEAIKPEDSSITGTKEGGSLRRASMELTRALAEMRKA